MNKRLWTVLISWLIWSAPCFAQEQADLVVVFDNSGSMRANDPQVQAKDALRRFVSGLAPDYRVGLIVFDQRVDLAVALAAADSSRAAALDAAISRINYRGQRTDIPAALERAISELKASANSGADRIIVFLTDGIVDTGNPTQDIDKARRVREELAREAADSAIRIYTIAFTLKADRALSQAIADATQGASFDAPAASDLNEAFAAVASALRSARAKAAAVAATPPPAPVAPPESKEVSAPEPLARPEPVPTPAASTPTTAPQAEPGSQSEPQVAVATRPEPAPAAPTPTSAADSEFGVADLTEEERAALREAGVDPEELFSADPGKAIIIPPKPTENRSGMIGILILAAAAGALLVGAAFWLRSRRGAGGTAASTQDSTVSQGRLEVRLRDLESVTGRDSIVVGDKPLMLGRTQGNDEHLEYLVVDRPTVGRRHALLSRRGTQFWIADQGSVNGTYVNDHRITGEHQVRHGDRIKLHKYVFEFDAPGLAHAPEEAPSRADATMAADAATLVGAAALAARNADRIGDTGIVAAGNRAADSDLFSDSGIGSRPDVAPSPVAMAAAEQPAQSEQPRTELLGSDADASAFFDDAISSGFGHTSANVMPPTSTPAADSGMLPQTVVTGDLAATDPFADFGGQLSDGGPPTIETDLSATPFLATGAVAVGNGELRRPFAELDNAMSNGENEADSPGTVRLPQFNPDLTATDDDFEMFDVTGSGDDTVEGDVPSAASGNDDGARKPG